MTRERVGRRNRYVLHPDCGFRHSSQRDLRVGPFLDLLTEGRLSHARPLYLVQEMPGPPSGHAADLRSDGTGEP